MLREVKYLEARQAEIIPNAAQDIYSSRELLWQYVANLELTTGWYNKILSSVLDVEMPLIQGQLTDIDNKLREAQESLCWISKGEEISTVEPSDTQNTAVNHSMIIQEQHKTLILLISIS